MIVDRAAISGDDRSRTGVSERKHIAVLTCLDLTSNFLRILRLISRGRRFYGNPPLTFEKSKKTILQLSVSRLLPPIPYTNSKDSVSTMTPSAPTCREDNSTELSFICLAVI
jgi:hypothetical protein